MILRALRQNCDFDGARLFLIKFLRKQSRAFAPARRRSPLLASLLLKAKGTACTAAPPLPKNLVMLRTAAIFGNPIFLIFCASQNHTFDERTQFARERLSG